MLLYPLVYYLRTVSLAFIIVFLEGRTLMQLIITMYLNIAIMAVLTSVRPYAIRQDTRKELLGELLTLFVTQMFFVLLNIGMQEETRSVLEYTTISVLVLAISIPTILHAISSF